MKGSDRLDRFRLQHDKAKAMLGDAKRGLKRFAKRVEAVQGRIASLEEEMAAEQMRRWGSEPDWNLLLDGRQRSIMLAAAFRRHANRLGLRGLLTDPWPDTHQRVLAVEPGTICRHGSEHVAASIRQLQAAIKPHRGGFAWVQVSHRGEAAMDWRLEFNAKGTARIRLQLKQPLGGLSGKACLMRFPTLESAIEHIARNAEPLCDSVATGLQEPSGHQQHQLETGSRA